MKNLHTTDRIRTRITAVCAIVTAILWSGAFTQAEPLRIMCLGDSRTAGPNSFNCYRPYLYQKMKAAGYSFDFVGTLTKHGGDVSPDTVTVPFDTDHEGHWGWPAHYLVWYDYQKVGAATWAREKQPDIVLAMLGFADMMQESDSSSVKADRTAAEIGGVIDSLRSVNPAVIILLANQYPANPAFVPLPLCQSIDSLNLRIPGVVEAKNTPESPVILVDTWTGFNPAIDIIGFGDGTHANKAGSMKVANAWLSKLWPYFDTIPPTVPVRSAALRGVRAAPAQPSLLFPCTNLTSAEAHLFTVNGRMLRSGDAGNLGARRLFAFFPAIAEPRPHE